MQWNHFGSDEATREMACQMRVMYASLIVDGEKIIIGVYVHIYVWF